MDLPVPTGQKSVIPLILLLLLLAVIAFFALGSLNLAGSTTTTSQSSECPGFNEREEAFQLAQFTEQYRKSHPTPANYGLGSWTVCYTDGPPVRNQTPEFKGGNNKQTIVDILQDTSRNEGRVAFLALVSELLRQIMGWSESDAATFSEDYQRDYFGRWEENQWGRTHD